MFLDVGFYEKLFGFLYIWIVDYLHNPYIVFLI
jgi:hypothetical protein